MPVYQHTQIGFVILGALGLAILGLVFSLFVAGRNPVVIAVLVILVITAVLFATLTIEIRGERLKWSFGPGLIRYSVPVAEIENYRIVKNPWFYGWGIRLTPNGLLYNVSGLDAVEIQTRDQKRFQLGTDQPEALVEAIERAKSNSV